MFYSVMEPAPPPALPHLPGVTFTDATPADRPEIAAFLTRAHPDSPTTPEQLERTDRFHRPGDPFLRVLARRGGPQGDIVGLTEVSVPHSETLPGWLALDLAVLPAELDGLLPGLLIALAETHALAHGGTTFLTRVKEHWPERQLWQERGYTEHDRLWNSTLDLRTLNFQQFAAQEQQARATGVKLTTLRDLGGLNSEANQRNMYDLIATLLRDVPTTTPIQVWPYELWQERYLPTVHHPEGIHLALTHDGQWIGISELHLEHPARPGTLHNGLTGVRKEWRGHHLGLALKLAAARSALQRGYTHSRTSNHSINQPMLAINEAMGFVRETATITLKKEG